jgi:hypothetical protein
MMEDEVNENNVYVRHVECTWVAHSFPDYGKLGIKRILYRDSVMYRYLRHAK